MNNLFLKKTAIFAFSAIAFLNSCSKDEIKVKEGENQQSEILRSTNVSQDLRWDDESLITYYFLDKEGSDQFDNYLLDFYKSLVWDCMKQWSVNSNVVFEEAPTASRAKVRIKFCEYSPLVYMSGASYIGTDCKKVKDKTAPTVWLGIKGLAYNSQDRINRIDYSEYNRAQNIVLHELGHVLGLIDETKNPKAPAISAKKKDTIKSNILGGFPQTVGLNSNGTNSLRSGSDDISTDCADLFIKYFPNREDAVDLIYNESFVPYKNSEICEYLRNKEYDSKSIMLYPEDTDYYSLNYELSAGDKANISKLYPLASSGYTPLYRVINQSKEIKYTTSYERDNIANDLPYRKSQCDFLGYMFKTKKSGTSPLYQYYYTTYGMYILSTSRINNSKYTGEKILGYVYPNGGSARTALVERYNGSKRVYYSDYDYSYVNGKTSIKNDLRSVIMSGYSNGAPICFLPDVKNYIYRY